MKVSATSRRTSSCNRIGADEGSIIIWCGAALAAVVRAGWSMTERTLSAGAGMVKSSRFSPAPSVLSVIIGERDFARVTLMILKSALN